MRQFQVQVLSQISSFFPVIKRGILHYIIFTEEKNFFDMLQHLNQDCEKYYPITYTYKEYFKYIFSGVSQSGTKTK